MTEHQVNPLVDDRQAAHIGLHMGTSAVSVRTGRPAHGEHVDGKIELNDTAAALGEELCETPGSAAHIQNRGDVRASVEHGSECGEFALVCSQPTAALKAVAIAFGVAPG